jgi:hypothetical protein
MLGMEGGTQCLCEPVPSGTSVAGAACPIGEINPLADFCQDGLNCLWVNPGDADAASCAGGNPANCPAELQNRNPVCVGGKCGASYCAASCDVGGGCLAGFQPVTVFGQCFCQPV